MKIDVRLRREKYSILRRVRESLLRKRKKWSKCQEEQKKGTGLDDPVHLAPRSLLAVDGIWEKIEFIIILIWHLYFKTLI